MRIRHSVYVTIFAVAMSISLCSAQTKAVEKHAETLFEGRPFFTDSALYNLYDLGGSPLGIFEKEVPRFGARVGYRYGGVGDMAGNYWDAPTFWMGDPGKSAVQIYYRPNALSYADGDSGAIANLLLHRFGFVAASQGTSGAVRAAFSAGGFYGKQEWDKGDSARVIMGIEKLRLDVGSQVHPLVRIGFYIGANLLYDTLYNSAVTPHRDCSAHTNLPEFGGSVDVGGEELPVRAVADFSYAFSGFSYSLYPGQYNTPLSAGFDGGDANAVKNDSLSVFLTVRSRTLQVADGKFAFKPGLFLGYTGNSGEMREPDHGDNYPIPLLFGGAREGLQYSLNSFRFGVGSGFEALGYVDAHVEYSLAALWLNCGPRYTGTAVEKSRTLHNVAVGVSSRMNKYIDMPAEITPRLAWFTTGNTNAAGAALSRLGFEPLNVEPGMSKHKLYEPQNFLDGFTRTSGFTIGADCSALEGSFNVAVWTTFLSSGADDGDGGIEFGLRAEFLLK